MKQYLRIYLLISLFLMSFVSGQIVTTQGQTAGGTGPIGDLNAIVFRYDEAGNQVYRGYNIEGQGKQDEPTQEGLSNNATISEDDKFWLGINVYPVPVKSTLTISWNEENNALIDNVTLYQHNTLAFLFQQQNIPNLNQQVQIKMSTYYPGVYILVFQLKDGRVMSRNIIKE